MRIERWVRHSNVIIGQNDILVGLHKRGPWGRDGALMTGGFNYVDVWLLKIL